MTIARYVWRTVTNVFSDIYRTNAWHGSESRSGPGSGFAPTLAVADAIMGLVNDLDIETVLDLGCGDGLWMPPLPGYVGMDVAPEAIEIARRRHPGRPYLVGDEPNAAYDLVICRDVVQHLSLSDGLALLQRIAASGSRWLLASTYMGGVNVNIVTGDAYSPDLQAEPFSLGVPFHVILDGYGYEHAGEVRDPRKHLGLWRLD